MKRVRDLCRAVAACWLMAAGAQAAVEDCASCHPAQYQDWKGSHHDLAMQLPTADTVLGDFSGTEFSYAGVTSRFYREGETFFVRTDNAEGELQDFPVEYVFGVYPLQQYLLPLDRGRLQALTIAWDSRPEAEGGQRWFHLYPDDAIVHDDPLHWTGPYHNWNTRCAECHSTDLEKNYDVKTRSFDTRWSELNVACEACHGPGDKHIELATSGKLAGAHQGGFPTDLAQRGEWYFPEGESIARRREPITGNQQIDSCGRCHSRRGTLGDYHYGADLLDTHRLSLPRAPLYYHDGQILDEVYVYGSFRQSKMHQQGVVCSNCHEPHSNDLRAEGNGVCASCHRADVYDQPSHHHHEVGSSGASCANCHMPETTYMVVDPRRDHSMRIPRPDLSVVMGSPNACNQCHSDQDAMWALDALRDWGVEFSDTARHPARAFAAAAAGDPRAAPTLAQLASDPATPVIWRAAAMESLGELGGRDALQTATQILYDDDPMLRTSTVRALAFLPLNQRFQLFQPLLEDDNTSVRMALADALAGVPLDQVGEDDKRKLLALFREFEAIQLSHGDMPSAQLQLGVFYLGRGDRPSAEAAYREALVLNPQMIPAMLNLADLLRAQGRDDEARSLLQDALAVEPAHAPSLHALGLLETRSGNNAKALEYLGQAAALEREGTRYRFVYAVALHDLGQPDNALAELRKLHTLSPQDQQVLLALTNYSAELGQRAAAREYAQRLTRLAPGNRAYQQLLQQLSIP